jgi:hypothetical protein
MLLRTKELLDAADIGKLQPRGDGPLAVTACPSPNAYALALPRKMQCSPTANVDRLKPFHARADDPPAPGPVSDPEQEDGREAELLLNRKTTRCHALPRAVARPHVGRRCVAPGGGAASLPGEGGRVRRRRSAPAGRPSGRPTRGRAAPAAVPERGGRVPPVAPSGFRLASPAEAQAGRVLVGRQILYRWPVQGWVLGKVVRVSRAAGFLHVVRYARGSALGVGRPPRCWTPPRTAPGP